MTMIAMQGSKVNMNCPNGATGTVVSGSDDFEVDGMPGARRGDIVRCDSCGLTRTIDEGADDVTDGVMGLARVGDHTTGPCVRTPVTTGVIITGSDTCSTN
jgi:uncharacterized Zn-binding protein involved in type VI secretion